LGVKVDFYERYCGEGENWRIYKVVLDVDEAGQGLLKTARSGTLSN